MLIISFAKTNILFVSAVLNNWKTVGIYNVRRLGDGLVLGFCDFVWGWFEALGDDEAWGEPVLAEVTEELASCDRLLRDVVFIDVDVSESESRDSDKPCV